jgi:predicted PurR-regulated permease PerM
MDGAAGVDGAVGATGVDGATGATGKAGAVGAAGHDGAIGAAGVDGTAGKAGAVGAKGAAGMDGAAGKAGAVGAKGAAGMDGAVGAAGATGMDGAVGAAGHDGAIGAAGVDGTAGVAGVAGVAGAAGDSRINLASGGLALLALTAALYLARGFFVPLLIGILGSYALHPLVNRLQSWRVPRSVGAALVLAMVVGSVSWIAVSVSGDAEALIQKWPEAARKLRQDLSAARSSAPSLFQNMRETAQQLQGAANDAGTKPAAGVNQKTKPETIASQAAEPTWLSDYTLAQTTLIVTVVAQTPIVLLLTYFLLASGVHFRRKLVGLVGPTLSRKKDAVRILEEIDVQVQRYLFAMLASNALLALGTWLAFLSLGVDQAGMWGVAAGVLHFVPYLGSALVAVGAGLAAFVQFGSLFWGLAVALVSLVIAAGVGFVFMTWLQSRFARVNTAVLFIALLFFGWLWGVWGLLLGAPLVAIAKVVFDRVESLKPAGELLGH